MMVGVGGESLILPSGQNLYVPCDTDQN
jgi:hypothetical protein